MTTLCFTCKTEPAGNDHGGPHSAYCAACQPLPAMPSPRGAEAFCAGCERYFTSDSAFDKHQVGMTCRDPATRGLVSITRRGLTMWRFPGGNLDPSVYVKGSP
jgi:hypothetical protein